MVHDAMDGGDGKANDDACDGSNDSGNDVQCDAMTIRYWTTLLVMLHDAKDGGDD